MFFRLTYYFLKSFLTVKIHRKSLIFNDSRFCDTPGRPRRRPLLGGY
jgi:hypothetical protein